MGRSVRKLVAAVMAPVALLGCVAGLPALNGCSGAGGVPEHILMFVSGDSRGYLEPCGCRRDQAGGLPGRATVIEDKKGPTHLVFDVGNLTPGDRPYELLKL